MEKTVFIHGLYCDKQAVLFVAPPEILHKVSAAFLCGFADYTEFSPNIFFRSRSFLYTAWAGALSAAKAFSARSVHENLFFLSTKT
jgi:hypothetical protein